MPLKDGISPERGGIRPRVPRRGKIYLGEEFVGTGKLHPRPLPYFRVPEEIKEFVGPKPTVLKVHFPYKNPMANVSYFYRRYGKGQVIRCIGDGEVARFYGEQGIEEIECLGEQCPMFTDPKPKCAKISMISVLLDGVPGVGVWQINTTSKNTVADLLGMMALVDGYGWSVPDLPFHLHRVPKKVAPDGKPKTVYVLHLECPLSMEELRRGPKRPKEIGPGNDDGGIEPVDESKPDDLYPASMSNPPDGDGGNGGNAVDSEAVEAAEEETNKKAEEAEAKLEAGKKNGVADLF